MIKSKYLFIFMGLLLLTLGIAGFCYAEDEIVIQSYLMRGFHDGLTPGPDLKTSSLQSPVTLHISPETIKLDEDGFAHLCEEVSDIYQIPYVIGLTSATMIWDGKKSNLNQAILAPDHHLYPIQFYPHTLEGNVLSVKIEAFKVRFNRIEYIKESARSKRALRFGIFEIFVETQRLDDVNGGEKWLDIELDLSLDQPVIMILPTGDRSCFLVLRVFRREARQFSVGLIGTKLEYFSVADADPITGKVVGLGDGYEDKNRAVATYVHDGYTFLFSSQESVNVFKRDPDFHLKKSRTNYYSRDPCVDLKDVTKEFISPTILVKPEIPESIQFDEIIGTIEADLLVDDSGNVMEVKIINPLHPKLDIAVHKALRQWKYEKINKKVSSPRVHKADILFNLSKKESEAEEKILLESLDNIGEILKNCADYCERLEVAALYYICTERIKETIFPGRYLRLYRIGRPPPFRRKDRIWDPMQAGTRDNNGEKNNYVYDYQIIRKDNRITERRILKEENGQLRNRAFDPLRTKRFYFNKAIYGPIGLLGRDSQKYYDYSLLKEESLNDREVWILEAKPKELILGKPNYGKLWIDKEDASVLKMEIEANSLGGYERIQADYTSRGIIPMITVELEFGIAKKGLRYPTNLLIQEAYSEPQKSLNKVSKTDVKYQEYQFFTVETKIKR